MVAAPAFCASASDGYVPSPSTTNRLEKSTPPSALPIGGIMMSLTSDVTIAPKAAPMMTPMARSTALPLRANSLNSFHMARSSSVAEQRLNLPQHLVVLLQALEVLLHVGELCAELRGGSDGASLFAGRIHGLVLEAAELGLRWALGDRAQHETGGEDGGGGSYPDAALHRGTHVCVPPSGIS